MGWVWAGVWVDGCCVYGGFEWHQDSSKSEAGLFVFPVSSNLLRRCIIVDVLRNLALAAHQSSSVL